MRTKEIDQCKEKKWKKKVEVASIMNLPHDFVDPPPLLPLPLPGELIGGVTL
jgi:hypothetical protein